MKTNKFLSSMAGMMVAIGITSCASGDDGFVQEGTYVHHEISLTATMAATRAASDPQANVLNTTNKVGVYVTHGTATIANGDNNEHSVAANGDLTTANTMSYPAEDDAEVNIYAYAPWQSSWSYGAEKTFTVAADQSTDAGYLASDLLYASRSATSQTSAVSLSFSHKLARLALTVATDDGTTVADATIKIVGTKPSATLTLADGTISEATGTAQDITIASGINITAGQSQTLYAVVVPQIIAANTPLIEVRDGGRVWKYHFTQAISFVSGQSHSLSVGVSTSKVTSTISGEASEPAN